MRMGFSLIELIMTIVIISIAFLGIPLIIENSARTIGWLQNSKAIYHGLAKIQIVRGKYWDENSSIYVLQTTEQGLVCNNDQNRSGHYRADNRRRCISFYPTLEVNFGQNKDGIDGNDIDDFHNEIDSDIEGIYTIKTAVKYVDYNDSGDGNLSLESSTKDQTNIKEIEVKVSKRGSSISTYRYYATNIGISTPFIKDNP